MSNERERRRIAGLWASQETRVLVTLVSAQGSSYRRVGARLLLAASGAYAGTISGGCLEADIVRKAEWTVRQGAVVEHYSTAFDDTAEVPYGLGCGGEVDLLLEPTNTPEGKALRDALQASLLDQPRTVATWLPSGEGLLRRCVWNEHHELLFASESVDLVESLVPPQAAPGIYVEHLGPPQRLICFGAGDDAQPLTEFAALMGWTVWVVDGRSQLAKKERFPHAARVLVASSADSVGLRRNDAVVLMTHSYEQDRRLLADLLSLAPGYLGMLGARHRSSLLLGEAASLAGLSLEQACDRVFAPVGFDLGGDGPETIALAIVAEIQAFVQGRIGASRRLTAEQVAGQIEQGGASRYLQVQCALDIEA